MGVRTQHNLKICRLFFSETVFGLNGLFAPKLLAFVGTPLFRLTSFLLAVTMFCFVFCVVCCLNEDFWPHGTYIVFGSLCCPKKDFVPWNKKVRRSLCCPSKNFLSVEYNIVLGPHCCLDKDFSYGIYGVRITLLSQKDFFHGTYNARITLLLKKDFSRGT